MFKRFKTYLAQRKANKNIEEYMSDYSDLFEEFDIRFEERTFGWFQYYGNVIVINQIAAGIFTEEEFIFALLHECGHVSLQHDNNPLNLRDERIHEQEFEADEWACTHPQYSNIAKEGAESFFARYDDWDNESVTHPSINERMNRIRSF